MVDLVAYPVEPPARISLVATALGADVSLPSRAAPPFVDDRYGSFVWFVPPSRDAVIGRLHAGKRWHGVLHAWCQFDARLRHQCLAAAVLGSCRALHGTRVRPIAFGRCSGRGAVSRA